MHTNTRTRTRTYTHALAYTHIHSTTPGPAPGSLAPQILSHMACTSLSTKMHVPHGWIAQQASYWKMHGTLDMKIVSLRHDRFTHLLSSDGAGRAHHQACVWLDQRSARLTPHACFGSIGPPSYDSHPLVSRLPPQPPGGLSSLLLPQPPEHKPILLMPACR
jgi:hypothetical protein